jgi:hypothetical protein
MKEEDMKRVLVRKEKVRERLETLKKQKRLRESGRTEVDLKALREVQEQFDGLIDQMMSAKVLLAGLAIGMDHISVDSDTEITN